MTYVLVSISNKCSFFAVRPIQEGKARKNDTYAKCVSPEFIAIIIPHFALIIEPDTYLFEIFFNGFFYLLQIKRLPDGPAFELGIKGYHVPIFLKIIRLRAVYPFGDFQEILFCVDSRNDGCPEFVGNAAIHYHFDAQSYAIIIRLQPDRLAVIFQTVFDVHGYEIDKIPVDYFFQDIGPCPV